MAARIFVGNLPFSIDSEGLRQLFSQAGTIVSAEVVMDRMTGRARGFGFVEMASDEETQNAINTLNGQEIDGRKIVVNLARPREERPRNGGFDNRRRRE